MLRCVSHTEGAPHHFGPAFTGQHVATKAVGLSALAQQLGDLTAEHARQFAAHESPHTTRLYDRTSDAISLESNCLGRFPQGEMTASDGAQSRPAVVLEAVAAGAACSRPAWTMMAAGGQSRQ